MFEIRIGFDQDEKGFSHLIRLLPREFVGHQLFDPFLVGFGSSGMPAVQTIELDNMIRMDGYILQDEEVKHASTLQTFPRPRSKRPWSSLLNSLNGSKLQLLPCLTRPRMEEK